MPTVSLPTGTPGKQYLQCIQITGSPSGIGATSLPDGVTATLNGRTLCIKAASFPATEFDWAVEVLSCSGCDGLELFGTVRPSADDCPCVQVEFPVTHEVWTDVRVGEYFEKYIPYNGSAAEFCADCLPKCLEACLVGRSVKLFGVLKSPVHEIRFALKNSCTCECVEFVAEIKEPCNIIIGGVTAKLNCPVLADPGIITQVEPCGTLVTGVTATFNCSTVFPPPPTP